MDKNIQILIPNFKNLISALKPQKFRFILVFLSGILGLITSVMVLKYIERTQNESFNLIKNEVYALIII